MKVARRAIVCLASAVLAAGCAWMHPAKIAPLPPPKAPAGARTEIGMASWYGPGFDGKRTSSGEIYNQEDLTAASNTIPLGTEVMVTNLANGRSVQVRINDHGPFKKGRKIDLSHRAAKLLGLIGPGTARVRIAIITPNAMASQRPGYYVQVGSFSDSHRAASLRRRLMADFPDTEVQEITIGRHHYYRVESGHFATRSQAQRRAIESARMGLPVVIVSR